MKTKKTKKTTKTKDILTIPLRGYKALFAMAKGDFDEAYKLTHKPK